MSKRRGGVGVAVAHGYLYAFGGHDAPASNPSASRFDCVERYDPTTDTWTIVTNMSTGRDAMGVALMGDRLFVVGGYDGQTYLNVVESYDPLTNEWHQVRFQFSRCFSGFLLNEAFHLFITGGCVTIRKGRRLYCCR